MSMNNVGSLPTINSNKFPLLVLFFFLLFGLSVVIIILCMWYKMESAWLQLIAVLCIGVCQY